MATENVRQALPLLVLFAPGAVIMRGAGCIINDIIDRKIDAQVERTRNRPLASGELGLHHAFGLLAVLLVLGLVILLQLNSTAIIYGLVFFIPVVIYPFMKRYIAWPQAFLGITFNAGAIIGWAAVAGELEPPALLLYAACFFWTLGYDTIYAHQDRKYDAEIGVKSTAVSMGRHTKKYLALFYVIMVVLLFIAGRLAYDGYNYIYISGLVLAAIHLAWQVLSVNLDKPEDCMRKFRSNGHFGWIVFIAIVFGNGWW